MSSARSSERVNDNGRRAMADMTVAQVRDVDPAFCDQLEGLLPEPVLCGPYLNRTLGELARAGGIDVAALLGVIASRGSGQTNIRAEVVSAAFAVEPVEPAEAPEADKLWQELHGPKCAANGPSRRFVARETSTARLLGVAQYSRTFPPEDGCATVLVVPETRHRGVGVALLQMIGKEALRDGIRNLGMLVSHHETGTMELLDEANVPIRVHPLVAGFYVEIDLCRWHEMAKDPGSPSSHVQHVTGVPAGELCHQPCDG